MSLDLRKLRILQAIIDDYVTTAAPVGSRAISKHSGIGLSSATIRNEMFDLKELGLLEQPHTSAGSMPSDKAYRLYVNSIMQQSQLNEDETAFIKSHLTDKINGIEDVVKKTAVVLSEMTNCMSVVMSPQFSDAKLKRIQLVPVSVGKALLVIVTDTGLLRDTIIAVPHGISESDLDRISEMLTNSFIDSKLKTINESLVYELFSKLGERREFLLLLNELSGSFAKVTDVGSKGLELHGANNLLSFPEYSDIESVRKLMGAIEQRDLLYRIMSDATNVEFSVKIGSENEDPKLQNCSVVTATYKINGDTLGSMGVIGPTRMNYSRVIAVLKYIGNSLSEVLTDMYKDSNDNTPKNN